jgi:non-specific serine/threonine protein kinase/serine/threonine-protein kinase
VPPSHPGDAADLTAAQQQRADDWLDRLLDQPEAERAARLAELAADDPAVAAEVASLLDAAAACGDFLSQPATPSTSAADAPDPGVEPGLRIGPWRVVREVGYGGMGEVYEAERVEGGFTQRAALKLLRREASEQVARFHVERQILARLEHPGIARLLDGGIAPDGRPYMAMEFVEGTSITAHCAEIGATLEQRLALFLQVCDAVAFAHRHLVVHRDLKPANILVNAEGQVRLLDFGIAKLLDADDAAAQTRTAAAPLTPLYAAPEQLTGGAVTTATDVYALGLLLFDLLTGEPPWPAGTTPVAPMLRALQAQAAPAPSSRAATRVAPPVPARLIEGDLDAIVAKALRAEPQHRYATVEALRRDIVHAQQGEAVTAREGARLYAVGRLLRRYRWAVASAGAVFVALALGLGATAWQAHRAAEQRDLARRDAAREEALRYQIVGLFRRAIADHGADTPTAKTMLDKSAQRVLHEYRDQPELAGQVVLALTELYEALEDVQGSAALLEGYLAQAGADADPFAVADARQKLAGIELMRGHVEHSGQLLDQSEAYWAHETHPHPEERLEGLGVRAQWQRARGDLDGAIATQRAAIAQRTALFGHDQRETASLLNSLAITLASANHLDEALQAYKETSAIYDRLGIGDRLDAQIIRANTGTLALRIGRLHEAEALLKDAIEHERALAGDSAAVAASLGYYGKVLSLTDRAQPAIETLREASAMGSRYAGESSPLALQNRLFLGEAQFASGDRAAARGTLEAALGAARAHYPPTHPLVLRGELSLAAVDAAEGHRDAAKARLEPIVAVLRKAGGAARQTLAQALLALGGIALSNGDAGAAVAACREAVQLHAADWPQNWELAVARERLAEALAASGASGEAKPLLVEAEAALRSELGAGHPEALRAQRTLEHLPA